MTALKWITTEAKRLKKQYPNRYSKWTDYVKQASAIYATKHSGMSTIGKPHRKKKIAGVKETAALKKELKKKRLKLPHDYSTEKRKRISGIETKSKSHTDKNKITANIQVGRIGGIFTHRDKIEAHIADCLRAIEDSKTHKLNVQTRKLRAYLSSLKRQLREQNSHINSLLR